MKSFTKLFPILVFILIIFEISAFSQEFKITSTEQLNDNSYVKQIDDLYLSGEEGTFLGSEDVDIYYNIFKKTENEKGAILLSSGRTEAALKYKEVIFDLYNKGYSVYIIDHRGQGLSGRMTEDKEMGYVDDFQYYVDDMKQFYDEFLAPNKHSKIYLLSHSLGGAIAMSYIEQYPEDFNAAAFCSPMLGFDWYICPLAKILSGKKPKYAPGQSGYSNDYSKFEGNDVTGSQVRFNRKIDENNKFPESRLGGVSVQWLNQSCKQLKSIFRNIDEIEIPITIFAADNETVVNPKAYDKFNDKANRLGKKCELYRIDNAQHEILMEKDEQRTEMISKSLDFYEKN